MSQIFFYYSQYMRRFLRGSEVAATAAGPARGRSCGPTSSLSLYGFPPDLALESEGEIIWPVCLQELSGFVSLCERRSWLGARPPRERGEMCLTYAQHTRSGRLKQQDTINDHRIRLLQYGLSRPHLLHRGSVIFHGPACLCVFVVCLCASVCLCWEGGPFYPLFLLSPSFLCLSPSLC